jgi:hypothetical protein
MEEGKFNTEFIQSNQKVNVRELLGNIIEGDLDTNNDIVKFIFIFIFILIELQRI